MTTMRDPDLVIGAWLASGPVSLPVETRGSIAAAVATTRQRRPARIWPLRWMDGGATSVPDTVAASASRARPDRSRLSRTVIILALVGALVALLVAFAAGGGSLRGDRSASPSPNPSASASPSVASPPASGLSELFRSETSIGTIEWTRVESATRIFPWAEAGGQIIGFDESGAKLTSEDGVTWEPMADAEWAAAASYTDAGDTTLADPLARWLRHQHGAGLLPPDHFAPLVRGSG